MVKPVSLSDRAFAALRKEKQAGESDSDVVLRLIRAAREATKDPLLFIRNAPKRKMIDPAEHRRLVADGRDADTDRDPWGHA